MNDEESVENAPIWAVINWDTGIPRTAGMTVAEARTWVASALPDPPLRVACWVDGTWIEPEPVHLPWAVVGRHGLVRCKYDTAVDATDSLPRWDTEYASYSPHRVCRIAKSSTFPVRCQCSYHKSGGTRAKGRQYFFS